MSLRDLPRIRTARRGRASSHDPAGGNRDFVEIPAAGAHTLLHRTGPGVITHIWMTLMGADPHLLRSCCLRMWWDGEDSPSVDVPVGDFFGVGHGETRNFCSLPLQMSPQDGKGMNCFFPMPFNSEARIELLNEGPSPVSHLFYYVDYEELSAPDPEMLQFHACFNRWDPCPGIDDAGLSNWDFQMEGLNPSGEGNYEVLRAEGRGHYVGCVLSIHNLRRTHEDNWYGEGDDMIFIDGDERPTLHGTGTEDYFNTAWGPRQVHHGPYHGLTMPGGPNWSGRMSMYRFHIEDPVMFTRSLRVTIEHGHANRRSDDWSSVAYWYQDEPHGRGLPRIPVSGRIPRPW